MKSTSDKIKEAMKGFDDDGDKTVLLYHIAQETKLPLNVIKKFLGLSKKVKLNKRGEEIELKGGKRMRGIIRYDDEEPEDSCNEQYIQDILDSY